MRPPVRLLGALLVSSQTTACDDPGSPTRPQDAASAVARFDTEIVGYKGRPDRRAIACSTCHGGPDSLADRNPGPVHSMQVQHGTLRCLSCHDRDARDSLHLADGTLLPFVDAMVLCAQCHGLQKTDYDHGAHGGMRGYWDLSRGPRTRNHCLVCHDPHAPAYPLVRPARGPTDLPSHVPAGHPT